MFTVLALTLMWSNLIAIPLQSNDRSGGTPRVQCEIELASWCIAMFDGTINMGDGITNRVWKLQARSGMENGPLSIIEEKGCSNPEASSWKMLGPAKIIRYDGTSLLSFKYGDTSGRCRLEFRFPSNGDSSTYKQVMLYGVLVGGSKDRQLYSINN